MLDTLKKEGYQMRNIAFISPTIGDQFNSGIKRVANILDRH